MSDLETYRKQIDEIDKELVRTLARRFEVTRKVGKYKRDNNLPPADSSREALMFTKFEKLAKDNSLDPELLSSIMRLVVTRVVSEHKNT